MKDVAAGKDSLCLCLKMIIDIRARCDPVHRYADPFRQLILRNQSDRQKKCVAGIILFGSGDRLSVPVNLGNGNACNPLFSVNFRHGMAQLQRNIIVVETLYNISLKAAGIWHQLGYHLHLSSLQRHTPCHDKPDITRAQDYNFLSHAVAFYIHQTLGSSRRKNAGRPVTRNIEGPSRALPASHGQDDCACLDSHKSFFSVDVGDFFFTVDINYHRIQPVRNFFFCYHLNIAGCIFRSCKFFFECMKSESVMDALI